MKDNNTFSTHHIVFAPKYRRQKIYGKIKIDIGIGNILRKLCENHMSNNFKYDLEEKRRL